MRMAFHAVSVARGTSTGRQDRRAAGSLPGLVRTRLVGSDNTANITLLAASLSNLRNRASRPGLASAPSFASALRLGDGGCYDERG
jgi:hypothetical protein